MRDSESGLEINDDLNRLTGSTVYTGVSVGTATPPCSGGSAASSPTLGFVYDAAGNIASKTVSGVTSTYTYAPSHPYAVASVTNVNGGTYTASYDADGDMVTRNGDSLTWTVTNLPESISSSLGSSTLDYGPEDQRYYQSATFNGVTTDTTYIAGGLFEVVSSSSGTEYRHNIIADGQVIAVHTITNTGAASTDYLHYDQLGSVDAVTNDSGSVIQTMSFDAYGQRRQPTNWDYGVSQNTLATMNNYTNRGYTDQEQLDNLSLVDMNGRVYDPTTGRFISADPFVEDWQNSQDFDRYTYVYDSPLEYTDPSGFNSSGLCPVTAAAPVGHAVTRDTIQLDPVQCTQVPIRLPPAPGSNAGGPHEPNPNLHIARWLCAEFHKACEKPAPSHPQAPEVVYMPIISPPAPRLTAQQLQRILESEGVCKGGVISSRSNNPHLRTNMKIGALAGGGLVAAIGAGVVINIIGFPEAEMAEGGIGIWGLLAWGGTVGTGAFVGAAYGVSAGGAIGYGLTPPASVPCT